MLEVEELKFYGESEIELALLAEYSQIELYVDNKVHCKTFAKERNNNDHSNSYTSISN